MAPSVAVLRSCGNYRVGVRPSTADGDTDLMSVRASLVFVLLLCIATLTGQGLVAAETDCDGTAQPGDNIAASIGNLGSGRMLCLVAGTYQSFAVTDGHGTGVTIRGAGVGSTFIDASGNDLVLIGNSQMTVSNLSVRGNVYVARSRGFSLSSVRVERAGVGVHIDDNSDARLSSVTISGSSDVGLLVRSGSTVDGSDVHVLDSAAVGVAAVANAGSLSLRDSEVGRGGSGPGIFAGISGCADLGAGSLDVPSCFYANLGGYVAHTAVTLERVSLHDGPGTGLVLFPGVTAEVRQTEVTGWGLTGMFVWGATAHVSQSNFHDDVEHAIEYRSYPRPDGIIVAKASGVVEDTVVRASRPLPDGALGGGMIAQAAEMSLARDTVSDNAGIGVLYENGSSGQVSGSTITNNGHTGLCINRGNAVTVAADTSISGNAGNDPHGCGG